MLKKTLISVIAIHFWNCSFAQYTGGSNDGFANTLFNKQIIADVSAFKGGNNDGSANASFSRQNVTDVLAFRGGNNDGVAESSFTRQYSTDNNAFKGGTNDGFAFAIFNRQNNTDINAFRGGSNDGSTMFTLSKISITDAVVFNGGIGRGEAQIYVPRNGCGLPGSPAVWNGSINNSWSNPGNWDCGNLPGIASNVIIPSGLARYPTVFASAEVRSLTLLPGATVTVITGINLKLNGQ